MLIGQIVFKDGENPRATLVTGQQYLAELETARKALQSGRSVKFQGREVERIDIC